MPDALVEDGGEVGDAGVVPAPAPVGGLVGVVGPVFALPADATTPVKTMHAADSKNFFAFIFDFLTTKTGHKSTLLLIGS